MRHATRSPVLAASALVTALLLTACSGSSDRPVPTSPGTGDGTTTTPSSEPGTTPPATEQPAPEVPTDLPAEALLPAGAWEGSGDARQEDEGAVAWRLPDACAAEPPADAATMLTVEQGDGAAEGPVGVQQVAVFADADAAVAAADRLAAEIDACAGTDPDETSGGTTFVAEPLDVGAQGAGLATDHYGASDGGDLDGALGSYLAAARRGTAVTLVTLDGGESTIGVARETVVTNAQAAWERLCRYDTEGC